MEKKERKKKVCIVVIGDIGRSPRMQYHACSLAREGFTVDIVGYDGCTPHAQVTDNPNIRLRHILPCPKIIAGKYTRWTKTWFSIFYMKYEKMMLSLIA